MAGYRRRRFTVLGRDLMLRIPRARVSGFRSELLGFAVAGADKQFAWADEATIEGDCVVVSSGKVAKPVAVRYAWANNPVCNLYNKDGLPACPFRSDDWPGVTIDAK